MAERWRQVGTASAVALAAWLAYELSASPGLPEPPAVASDAAAITLPSLEIAPPDLATLRATLERPLFDDDRRPNAPEEAAASPDAAPAAKAAPVRLSAIVVASDGSRMALVKPEGQDEPQRVRLGETVAGWKVAEMSDEAVTLTAGDQRVVVPLRVYEPPSARPPGRVMARRRAAEAARRAQTRAAATDAKAEEAAPTAPQAGDSPAPAGEKAPAGRRN